MITVQLDENGYFTGSYAKIGSIPKGIQVLNLPPDLTNYKTNCYKYGEVKYTEEIQVPVKGEDVKVPVIDEETGQQKVNENGELVFDIVEGEVRYEAQIIERTKMDWIFDEEKHNKLLDEISKQNPIKTQEQIIEELQSKNQELESTLDVLMTEIVPTITGMEIKL